MAVLPQLLPYYGDSPSILEILERQKGFFVAPAEVRLAAFFALKDEG